MHLPAQHIVSPLPECKGTCQPITKDTPKILGKLYTINILIKNLKYRNEYKNKDKDFLQVVQYLEFQRDKLIRIIEKKHGLICKGFYQDHDKEIREYIREHEYASHDEQYYNRYHAYDADSYNH